MKIINWSNRIDMTEEVANMTLNTAMHDNKVELIYINRRTGRETTREMSLEKAIKLAESRANDGRYKNFEFFIQ